MSYIIYIFRFCRRFVGPLVPHVGSQDHGEHGRSTCEALRSKAWGTLVMGRPEITGVTSWVWSKRSNIGHCTPKIAYAKSSKIKLFGKSSSKLKWPWLGSYTPYFQYFQGKNTLKLGCDCSHFSRLCHETTWGGSSLGGDSFRNTSCSSGWQTIPGLKPPWRRWSNGGPLEWDMMTDDDSTSCERTTLQDQDIEKFSCNRHVLVTLFKNLHSCAFEDREGALARAADKIERCGMQGLEPLNMDVFNRFVFAILMQVIRLVCPQNRWMFWPHVELVEGLEIGDFIGGSPRVSLALTAATPSGRWRSLESPA